METHRDAVWQLNLPQAKKPGEPSRGGVAAETATCEASSNPSRGVVATESATSVAEGDPSRCGDASGNPDATDEGVDALDAGEDAATDLATGVSTDSATGEATDSATNVVTDSATEGNISTSAECDDGDHAAEGGLSGSMAEEGDEASASESDIARPPQTAAKWLRIVWLGPETCQMLIHQLNELDYLQPDCNVIAIYLCVPYNRNEDWTWNIQIIALLGATLGSMGETITCSTNGCLKCRECGKRTNMTDYQTHFSLEIIGH